MSKQMNIKFSSFVVDAMYLNLFNVTYFKLQFFLPSVCYVDLSFRTNSSICLIQSLFYGVDLFIPRIQVLLNTIKSIFFTILIKKENHVIISIDQENMFDKIQHPFMILKNLNLPKQKELTKSYLMLKNGSHSL